MTHLTQASRQLFSRPPDERFETLSDLYRHCQEQRKKSVSFQGRSALFQPLLKDGRLSLKVNGHAPCRMNDWSFGQLCHLAGAAKETVNRLRPDTAAQALAELVADRARGHTPLQALVYDDHLVRAVTSDRYRRLWNADLLAMLLEFAADFGPPPKGKNGGTGLYAGEQDLFVFLIDPGCWVEIGGQAFAPGFFVWNSEVGRRTIGVSTFWFQTVCANHIVWDVLEFKEFTRRHVGEVAKTVRDIRYLIEALVQKRDERKDGFATVIAKAMETAYGRSSQEVIELLGKAGLSRALAKRAAELARERGAFTVFAVVDALTQLAGEQQFAGSRTLADRQASELLALAAT